MIIDRDPTVAECPGLVQALLRRRVDRSEKGIDQRAEADAAVERLASRLPTELRPASPIEATGRARLAQQRDDWRRPEDYLSSEAGHHGPQDLRRCGVV